MADERNNENRDDIQYDAQYDDYSQQAHAASNREQDFDEETAAEIAPRIELTEERLDYEEAKDTPNWMGWVALALSVLSIFGFMPILFGAGGIIIGFMARSRGLGGLGTWAIGIGVISIALRLFVAPFFFFG